MQRNVRCILAALLLTGLAAPAFAGKGDYVIKHHPAKLEKIKGSDLYRVILTEKATERTGIEFAPVREENVRRWLVIGGKVEPTETLPAVQDQQDQYDLTVSGSVQSEPMRITVPMVAGWMGGTQTVRVFSMDDPDDLEDDLGHSDDEDDVDHIDDEDDVDVVFIIPQLPAPNVQDVKIRLSEPVSDPVHSDLVRINYEVEGTLGDLKAGDRVPVKYSKRKSGGVRKVVPYSAVLYDPYGKTWVYHSPEPLVFVRLPIVVDFIEGDRAILKEGPPVGTEVVTAGAAELFGVENKIGL